MFPYLDEVLDGVQPIVTFNALEQVNKTVVEAARESLVVGQA